MVASFKSEAIEVLKESKKPFHIKELTEKILKRGNIKTKGNTPESTLYSVINEDIKKKGMWSAFIKVESGLFSINPSYKEEEKIKKKPIKVKIEEPEETIILLGQTIKSKGKRIL